jgi:uncharacterized protein YciI
MRYILIIILIAGFACSSPETKEAANSEQSNSANILDGSSFDRKLAEKAGADEYGMKTYVMAFLKRGPNRDLDSARSAELQRAHLDNISRMAEAGKLVMAGPFLDDHDIRGIYIFNVPTVEEAERLTNTDPAIQAGSLVMELRPWYGSAGLVFMGDVHEKVAEREI